MHKVMHSRTDMDRLYVSRKEGIRGLAIIKENVDATIQGLDVTPQDNGENLNRI